MFTTTTGCYPFIIYSRSLSRHVCFIDVASVPIPFYSTRCNHCLTRVVASSVCCRWSIAFTVTFYIAAAFCTSVLVLFPSAITGIVAVALLFVLRSVFFSSIHLCFSHTVATA